MVGLRVSVDEAPPPPAHKAGVDVDRDWLDELWDDDSPDKRGRGGSPAGAGLAKSPTTAAKSRTTEDEVEAFLDENWDSDE